ncbi:altronate hydrolase [Spirochaetia bacterium]|nr:altronate hydrolase [Spirochaetia bacterium]
MNPGKNPQPLIRINAGDNVAVALRPLRAGEKLDIAGISLAVLEDIPLGHKIALQNIGPGDRVIKYGYPIGAASAPISAGAHVHTHNVRTLLSETPVYSYKSDAAVSTAPDAAGKEAAAIPEHSAKLPPQISAYRRRDGQIGIRNEIWIIPTVGCVNSTAEALARWADKEFGGAGSDGAIDGVYAWTHPYGCSQMGSDHEATRTILADLAKHPNAAAVLVVALGCENNTIDGFKEALGPYAEDSGRIAFMVTQNCDDEIAEGRRLLAALAAKAAKAKREPVKASELVIGMKCGGSDGLSGITANALVGQVCDSLTAMGAGVILTEVPEMFGAEQMLMDRCESRELFEKTVSLVETFKEYYRSHNQVVYDNPSPGNKAGGITTLEDKSCGCVQKSGKALVRGVYRYGERVTDDTMDGGAAHSNAAPGGRDAPGPRGLVLLEGPGNDIVSSTAMTAAGAHLILFTTGRGTPLGAPVPTVKISSNSDLARRKANWIDFDAGRLLTENAEDVRTEILRLIMDIVSGNKKTRNEENGYREIAIFKNGVTL